MQPLKFKLGRSSLEVMYNSFILPVMEYANVVWGGAFDCDIAKLEKIHVDGMRLVTGATARSNIRKLYEETAWIPIRQKCENAMVIMMFKMKNNLSPDYLYDLLPEMNNEVIHYNLRNNNDLRVPFSRLESFRRSFVPTATKLWNLLDIEIRSSHSLNVFK